LSRAALILAIVLFFSLTGCHFHSRGGDSWPAKKSSYERTPDGYYRVREGDTLHAIAFDHGLDWRDIASWNHISRPYTIYPDQELRLFAPGLSSPVADTKSSPTVTTSGAGPPRTAQTSTTTSGLKTPQATTRATEPADSPRAQSTPIEPPPGQAVRNTAPAVTAPGNTDPSSWVWPTEGRIVSSFQANDPSRNGIEIGGDDGQPIVSSAAGEVVYSGNGLIGYGELIIIKHSDRFLSAYAHNRKRMVSEGDRVPAGMKIAEMGRDDRNKPLLHFEIRVNGSPQNPMNYLPPR